MAGPATQQTTDSSGEQYERLRQELEQGRARLEMVLRQMPNGVMIVEAGTGKLLIANEGVARIWRLDLIDLDEIEVRCRYYKGLSPDGPEYAPLERPLARSILKGEIIKNEECRIVRGDGSRGLLSINSAPILDSDGKIVAGIAILSDITDRKDEQAFHDGQKRVLEMVAAAAPLADILASILNLIELQSNGMLCSILLLGDDGVHVRHGAAPSLPAGYIKAINGSPIGPKAGSCGTAMYRGTPVIVTDIMQDPLWEDYRGLAQAFDLRACWSTPIFSSTGKILGSFAMYYHEPRHPSAAESRLTKIATHLTGIAIERELAEQTRKLAEEDLRRSSEKIRDLAGKLITAQEEERRRISRELHDDIVQKIAVLAISMSRLKQQAPSPDDPLVRELAALQQRVFGLADDVRQLSHRLHPSLLEHAGLIAALRSFADEFTRLEGVEVKLTVPETNDSVPREVATCVYRVVQESLRNVAKHAQAKRAEVGLWIADNTLFLSVRDEGCGFEIDDHRKAGLGLVSIAERVHLCQGSVEIDSQPGQGTTLMVRIPMSGPVS